MNSALSYNVNKVLKNLYDALVNVKYPGINNYDLANFEATVLAKGNRCFLLHWILVEFFKAAGTVDNTVTADEASIVQWYTQFCVCIRSEALLGQCPLDAQLQTLVNLTEFINTIGDIPRDEFTMPEDIWDILPKWSDDKKNIIPKSCHLPTKLTYKEAIQYINTVKNSPKDSENNMRSETDAAETCDDKISKTKTDEISETSNKEALNSKIVDEFCEAFESVNSTNNHKDDKKNNKSTDNSIDLISSKFISLNEAFLSKIQMSKMNIRTEVAIKSSALDPVIQDTVIALEKLSKVLGSDEFETSPFD